MARKLDDKALAAIKAMCADKATNGEIHRAITQGNAGLDAPIKIGRRMVEQHAARFRRELKPESDPLQETSEVDAIDAIQRTMIRVMNREITRINDRSKQAKATPEDLKNMRDYSRINQELRRHFSTTQGSGRSKKASGGDKGKRTQQSEPASTLERLATEPPDTANGNGHDPASSNPPSIPAMQPSHTAHGPATSPFDLDEEEDGASVHAHHMPEPVA